MGTSTLSIDDDVDDDYEEDEALVEGHWTQNIVSVEPVEGEVEFADHDEEQEILSKSNQAFEPLERLDGGSMNQHSASTYVDMVEL